MPPDTDPVGKGYALWLMPDQPMFIRLARAVSSLSRRLSTQRFRPHITLLSRIIQPEEKVLGRSSRVADCLRPFRIELADVDYLDEFFRCVFATVRPCNAILNARLAACRVFGRQCAPYFPHVSLVYGRLPADRRKEIAGSLRQFPGQAFEVRKMALYRVNGPVRQWECIETFDLK
jgi:2'-5' RNA ligase